MNTPADDAYDANCICVEVFCANCGSMIELWGTYREVEDQSYKDHFCKDCGDDDEIITFMAEWLGASFSAHLRRGAQRTLAR